MVRSMDWFIHTYINTLLLVYFVIILFLNVLLSLKLDTADENLHYLFLAADGGFVQATSLSAG